ncbi:lipase maturation factor 1 [Arthrobacter sp. Hiyo8]|nr:lipase maturation factor 1 [Arthrobacter sp. Hiyo8]
MDWVSWFEAPDYEFARQVLQRGTAALYFIAFLSSLNQFPALLGEHGLLPVPRYVDGHRVLRRPSLFRWKYSDTLLRAVCAAGLAVSLTLVGGLPQLGPPWLPLAAFLALWLLYMSIVNVGQTFYGFGWEMLLLEMGFTVGFLGSDQVPPPRTILVLLVWLLFRLEFGAGMIKIHGGSEWRDLTALYYHHETQPMPGPLSRQAHLLPKAMHRMEVLGNHFAQLVVPFFLFAPQPLATIAAGIVVFTQLWLVGSGNFAWLNWSAIVLAFAAVSDPVAHAVLPFIPQRTNPAAAVPQTPVWWLAVVLAVTVLLLVLSYWPIRNLLSRGQLMNASFNRWQLVNTYGRSAR